ncbi:MAG: AI-2E family transporter [Thermotogae bacterium]|nr:AI-2E family transporter [Thermotogota bacterium]
MVQLAFLIFAFVLLVIAILLAFKDLWAPFILLVLAVMAFYRAGERFWGSVALIISLVVVLRLASSVLWPVGLALVIAFIFLPVVRRLERWRIPRGVSAAVIILGMFFLSILLGGLIVYQVYLQMNDVLRNLQDFLAFNRNLENILRSYGVSEDFIQLVLEMRNYVVATLPGLQGFLKNVPAFLSSSLEMAFSTIVGLVLGFYVLKDTDVLVKELDRLVPDDFKGVLTEMYQLLAQYFRGQVTVAFIVGSFVGLSLQILGIKYGFLIGFLAGIFNLVPNIGFALTVIFGSLIILVSEPNLLLAFLKFGAVMALDQLLETTVLTPKILGKSVGIHPVLVMLSLIIGATLFGALGVILAVPVAAFLRSLWIERIKRKL